MRFLSLQRTGLLCVLLLLPLLAACGGPNTPSPSSRLAPAQTSTKAQAVVQTALGQQGAPYKWGGCHPKQGFDCSGFVFWVFGENGVQLPRTTRTQIHAGRGVDSNYLNQADLVFFQFRHGLHVGIHLGNGDFIHSPKTGGAVKVASLRTGYWASRLVAARRVLD